MSNLHDAGICYELKDGEGRIVGCSLKYKKPKEKDGKVYSGKACPKDCEPVADCTDFNGKEITFIQFREPKYKGLIPGFKTAYCPAAIDWPQQYCPGVNAKNCKGDFEKDFASCVEACKDGAYAKYLCKGIRVPGLKQACEKLINGSKELCVFYCENSKLQLVE